MRFLLDMGLAQSTASFLRQQGHDVTHLREQGLQRLPDEAIIVKARSEERVILLTHDLDFGRMMALSRHRLPSVITFRLRNMQPEQVNHYLQQVLEGFSERLVEGALVSVSEQAIRVRVLPISGEDT